jgi:translation initiation factor IF-3
MIRRKPFQRPPHQPHVTANYAIHCPEVRVLDEHGEMIGVMPTAEAIQQAKVAEKDLILVTEQAQPPIAKIISISKYRYQLQQKKAEGRKKSKAQEIKEVRFTPFIGEGDFQVRLRKIIDFLKRGDKVRLTVEFKGRMITKQEFGREHFDKVFAETADIASVEIPPKLIGKKMMAQLMPAKKTKTQESAATPVAK